MWNVVSQKIQHSMNVSMANRHPIAGQSRCSIFQSRCSNQTRPYIIYDVGFRTTPICIIIYTDTYIDTLLVDVSVISLFVSPPTFFSTKNENTFGSPGFTGGVSLGRSHRIPGSKLRHGLGETGDEGRSSHDWCLWGVVHPLKFVGVSENVVYP